MGFADWLSYLCKLSLLYVDFLEELNEPQRQAATSVEGPVMIIAGAGSGKTRVLTYRIAYLVKQGIDPFHILSLTFTNKAAREMKERIASVIGPSEAKNLWMGTFHSVFARILRSESDRLGYPSNFSIYDTDDAKSLIRTIINEMGLDDKMYKPNTVYDRISNAKNALITAHAYRQSTEFISDDEQASRPRLFEIYQTYTERCFKAGAMDFDDLLLKTYELFARFPEVLYKYQNRFQFILVDEFQDTNFAQYAIIRQLAALYQNICVVGDDAQSIYAFRGANIQNILDFEKDYPELQTFKLEQNYRSTQTIVDAANHLIAKNKAQLPKKVWTANPSGERIKVYRALTDNEEGQFVANQIFELQMNLQKEHSDFAILYRTNAQSRALEEALRKQNIPYRIYGGLSFYQRKEIKDILAYFRVVINPQDEEAIKRIINYPARGIGKVSLDKLLVAANDQNVSLWEVMGNPAGFGASVGSGIQRKIQEFRLGLERFRQVATKANAFELAQELAKHSGLLKELYADKSPEGVSRYENVLELLNGIKEFCDQVEAGTIDRTPTLSSFMEDVALLTDADETDDDQRPKVSLMTVHASKGLEFPVVFIVGLEDTLFPSQMSMSTRAELEEERRLFYVAITRAMEQLTISFAETRYRWGQLVHNEPSQFISELDQDLIDLIKPAYDPMSQIQGPSDPFRKKLSGQFSIPEHSKLRSTNQAKAAPGKPGLGASEIRPGMLVKHHRFGKGKVLNIEGKGPDKSATILFEGGEKRLLLKFARLEEGGNGE